MFLSKIFGCICSHSVYIYSQCSREAVISVRCIEPYCWLPSSSAFSSAMRSVVHSASITSSKSSSLITPSEAAMSGVFNITSRSLLSFFLCAAWPPLGRRPTAGWDAFEDENPLLLFEVLLFFADLINSVGPDDLAPLLLIEAPLLSLLFLEILLLPLLLRSLRPISSGETDLYIVTTLHIITRDQLGKQDHEGNKGMVRYLEDTTWDSSKSLLSRTSPI